MTLIRFSPVVCVFTIASLNAQSVDEPARAAAFAVEASENFSAQFPGAPRLQSFAWAQWEGKWIFIAGRTNGYHGVGPEADFPRARANNKIWVVDASSLPAKTHSFPLESLPASLADVKDQWMSTNLLYFQDGDTLYLAGGYGQNSAGEWVTHSILSSVHLPSLVSGVQQGRDTFSKSIAHVSSPHVQSSGGDLLKLDDGHFYLVGGHVFMGRYSDFQTNQEKNSTRASQQYLGEIRKLSITREGGRLAVSLVERYEHPEFARRDLNVGFTIAPEDLSLGAAAYGGVFTKEQLAFSKPIYWSASKPPRVQDFEQKMSAYSCARMILFDRAAGTTHTTFFGGISRWTWSYRNARLELAPRVGNKATAVYLDGMEWIDQISTLVRSPDDIYEVVHSANRMPGYVGTNAVFLPVTELKRIRPGIDVFDIQPLQGKRTLIGYIFGGVRAFPREFPYSDDAPLYNSGNVPTKASDLILAVYITVPPAR
jgi:hypothetical protein